MRPIKTYAPRVLARLRSAKEIDFRESLDHRLFSASMRDRRKARPSILDGLCFSRSLANPRAKNARMIDLRSHMSALKSRRFVEFCFELADKR